MKVTYEPTSGFSIKNADHYREPANVGPSGYTREHYENEIHETKKTPVKYPSTFNSGE